MAVIDDARARIPRLSRISAWIKHRILALFDLRLQGCDLKAERTQLALWLFPEVKDYKAKGRRFDRACKYLDAAIADQDSLRALRE